MKARPAASRKAAREILSLLAEQVGDALLLIEPRSLRFLEANEKAAALLGCSRSELMAMRADRVFPSIAQICQKMSCPAGQELVAEAVPSVRNGRSIRLDLTAQAVRHGSRSALLLRTQCFDRQGQSRAHRADREDLIETVVDFPTIIGKSDQIREICRMIGLVAKTSTSVLVQGESGTGKELVAQAIHFHSRRFQGPLIKVNCAALSETLLESELFGHKKGAFTGAIKDRQGRFKLADGGSLILDEIGSMSMAGQAKLLRVLQEQEFEMVGGSRTIKVDVRVIAITNCNLRQAIEEGTFREDLYYRLSAFPIRVPPLRERKVDIPQLARHFLKRYAITLKKRIEDIELKAISMLTDFAWPGNVRELENAIEYAVILERGTLIKASSLPDKLKRKGTKKRSLKEMLKAAEKQIILESLSKSDWVKSRAANLLGIDRRNFNYFLKKHEIQ